MPPEEKPIRPVRRSRLMMWLAMLVISATVAVAVAVDGGVRPAMLLFSAALLAFAIVRAVSPAPGPYGIAVRSRVFDIALLVVGALLIAVVTLALPTSNLG